MIEQAAELAHPPRVHLVFGARTATGLYDLPELEKMAAQWSWLTVTPSAMAATTASRLKSLGLAQDRIYVEDFGWSES